MKSQQKNNPKLVYTIVGPAYMKFQPQQSLTCKQQTTPKSFLDRFKSFFKTPSSKTQTDTTIKHSTQKHKQKSSQQSVFTKPSLKYVFRLTNEDILIGNQNQLDALFIGGVLEDYIDTVYLWSLNIKTAIIDVTIDQKKNLILLLTKNKLIIYQFNAKAIQQKPIEISSAHSQKQLRFVRLIKETIVVCGHDGIASYEFLQQNNQLKQKTHKKYFIDTNQLKIFRIPESSQNSLKIFFKQKQTKSEIISIWLLSVEINPKEIKLGKLSKIRDIPAKFEQTIHFTNYTSSIYFMHIENDLIAMRGAYILDILKTTKNVQDAHYKLIGQNKLIHISALKMETYSLQMDETKNPPKIEIKSVDSLFLPQFQFKPKFINIINILGSNFLIVFQNDSQKEKCRNGEIRYTLALTTQLKLEQKLIEVIPSQVKNVNFSKIQEKADIAQKMGLPQKDVYLNIWNKSQKSSVEDFKLLLDTMSYPTIKEQIQKKLKKSSMSYRQVLLIQQGCMSMLQNEVFGTNCTSQSIKNYFISHLLTRKLQLYRRFSQVQKQQKKAISQDESGKLLITIKSYNFLKNAHIGSLLLQLIQKYCNEDKDEILKIRWLIRIFRFQLRTVYQNLLTEIIALTKKKFIKLLQTIPQLLPFEPQLDSYLNKDAALYQGIWNNFIEVEWQKCFYLDNVETIQNKECLAQVCESVWFRRHWLSQHDFINLKKAQIQEIHKKNKSNYTFFYVIQALFDNITEPDTLRQTIDYIQDIYTELPQHIYRKIFLYRNLFEMFKENNRVHKIQAEKLQKFSQFLNLKDCEIFKAMFNYQKIKKGFIMKQMKPLYYSLSGPEVFHQGLLNYFASDLSEISDIKYLLNRMNNQKKQFHMQNQSIYEVIVRAMQLKLKIGSPKDIPLQEVIIYIQTIPLSDNNPVLKDLQTMRIINQQALRFRNSHLDMSIFQITKNSYKVFMALIHYEFESKKIDKIENVEQLKELSYRILAQLLILHAKIYSDTDITPILFIYLSRLMQSLQHFKVVKQLLVDNWIHSHFGFDKIITENLVLYMRKWILHKMQTYSKAQIFLRKLLDFLPQKAPSRLYIQAELQLALLLSTKAKPVFYPLCKFNTYVTLIEIQAFLQNIPVEQLIKLQPERLFVNIEAMQYWGSDGNLKEQKLENVYQIIILRLIACRKIKEAVIKLKELLNLKSNNPYNFIYPAIIMSKISEDLIQQNKKILLQTCSYLFSKSHQLLDFIDQLLKKVQTNQEQKIFLINKLRTFKQLTTIPFSKQNVLFQTKFISQLKNNELEEKYTTLLTELFLKLKRQNEQFMKAQYYLMFVMLCNKPQVFIKYVYTVRNQINVKRVRFMISYISQCPLFKKEFVLQFGVRLFASILGCIKSGINIQLMNCQFFQESLKHSYQIPVYIPQNANEYKMLKSMEKMKEKKAHILKQSKNKKSLKNMPLQYRNLQQYIQSKTQFVYDYPDSDDNEFTTLRSSVKKNQPKINETQFEEQFNLVFLSSRNTTDVMPYLSNEKQREHKKLYYQQKEEKQFIYNELSLDRPKEKNATYSNTLTDPIRNSNRISRTQSQLSGKPVQNLTPPQQSNRLLSVNVLDSNVNEPIQYEQLGIYRSMKCSSIKGEQPKHQQILIQQEAIERNMILETESEITKKKENLQVENYKIEVNLANNFDQQKIRETAFKKQKSVLLSQEQIEKLTVSFEEKIARSQSIDLDTLEKQCESNRMASLLQSIIRQSFLSQYGFSITLKLVQTIQARFPSTLAFNQKSLQIYKKSEDLQQKFSLDLPLKKIFVSEGLFLKQKRLQPLFELLVNNMYSCLNEDQLMKMCKVVTIAFKKPELQHQIVFGYLLQLIKLIEDRTARTGRQLNQSQKMIEKVLGYIRKLPAKFIKKRDVVLLQSIHDEKIRQRIVLQIVEWCMERNDEPTAQYFQQKYLTPTLE